MDLVLILVLVEFVNKEVVKAFAKTLFKSDVMLGLVNSYITCRQRLWSISVGGQTICDASCCFQNERCDTPPTAQPVHAYEKQEQKMSAFISSRLSLFSKWIGNPIISQTSPTIANNSTIQVNSTRCHPILFNLGDLSMEKDPKYEYGICPDTIFSPLVSAVILFVLVVLALFCIVGVIYKRKSGHIQARNPILLISTVFACSLYIILSSLRYLVGRKSFPCSIFALTFFIGKYLETCSTTMYIVPPLLTLPTILRMLRLFCLYRLNVIRTRNDRKKLFTQSTLMNTTIQSQKYINERTKPGFEMKDTNVRIFTDEANDVSPLSTNTSTTVSAPLRTSFKNQPEDNLKENVTTNIRIETPKESPSQDDRIFQHVQNPVTSENTDNLTDPIENVTSDVDFVSEADLQSNYEVRVLDEKDLKTINMLNFFISNKVVVIVYLISLSSHLILWLVLGGIEEGIYSQQNDPNSKKAFIDDAGLLVFTHGCMTNTKVVIMIVCQAAFYVVVELSLLIACILSDRDTWKIKSETLALIIFQVGFLILFGCEQIQILYVLVEFIFPSGNVLATYSLFDLFIGVVLPLIYAFVRDSKLKKGSEFSDIEKVLSNKKLFGELLDFSRRR